MPVLKDDAPKTIKKPLARSQYRMVDCLSEPLWALLHIWGFSKSEINRHTGVHNSYITWIDQGRRAASVYHEELFITMLYAVNKQAEKLRLKSPYSKLNSAKINATKIIIRNHEKSA